MFRVEGRQLCSFFPGLNDNMLQKPIYCGGEEILFLLVCFGLFGLFCINPNFCGGLL